MLIALDTAPLFYAHPSVVSFVPTFLLRSSFLSSFYPAFRNFRSLPPFIAYKHFPLYYHTSLDCLRLSGLRLHFAPQNSLVQTKPGRALVRSILRA